MRLDFDNDGSISVEDLKKSMVGLYDFLKNFDVLEATTQIKSKLYTDAIAYMQNELDADKRINEEKRAPEAPKDEAADELVHEGEKKHKKNKKSKSSSQ